MYFISWSGIWAAFLYTTSHGKFIEVFIRNRKWTSNWHFDQCYSPQHLHKLSLIFWRFLPMFDHLHLYWKFVSFKKIRLLTGMIFHIFLFCLTLKLEFPSPTRNFQFPTLFHHLWVLCSEEIALKLKMVLREGEIAIVCEC